MAMVTTQKNGFHTGDSPNFSATKRDAEKWADRLRSALSPRRKFGSPNCVSSTNSRETLSGNSLPNMSYSS